MSVYSKIYSLNQDVVYHIFNLRSLDLDGEMKDRGKDIKSWSQVCQGWRYTALGSGAIWGRILSLTFGGQYSRRLVSIFWLDELLKRSKGSPLWIEFNYHVGVTEEMVERRSAYLTNLIESNWERIQIFHVDLSQFQGGLLQHYPSPINFQHLTAFSKPAPILKSFRLMFPSKGTQGFDDWRDERGSQFFAGYAPKLIEFETDYRTLTVNIRHDWSMGLRRLKVRNYVEHGGSSFLGELLPAISKMNKLQLLDIYHEIIEDVNDRYTAPHDIDNLMPINLPNLRYVSIHSWAQNCLDVLQRVLHYDVASDFMPAHFRHMSFNYVAVFQDEMHLSPYESMLRSLVQPVFKRNIYTLYESRGMELSWMHVEYSENEICFSDFQREFRDRPIIPSVGTLDMGFKLPQSVFSSSGDINSVGPLATIFQEMSDTCLKNVTSLSLTVTELDVLYAEEFDDDRHDELTDDHLRLFSALTAVTSISLNQERILGELVGVILDADAMDMDDEDDFEIDPNMPIAFPNLQKVLFDGYYTAEMEESGEEPDWGYLLRNLIVFLNGRVTLGVPVMEVEFMGELPDHESFIASLQNFQGLKISWSDNTHNHVIGNAASQVMESDSMILV